MFSQSSTGAVMARFDSDSLAFWYAENILRETILLRMRMEDIDEPEEWFANIVFTNWAPRHCNTLRYQVGEIVVAMLETV